MVHPVTITVFITQAKFIFITNFCYNICILHTIIINKGSITTVESISQYFLEASAKSPLIKFLNFSHSARRYKNYWVFNA